MPKPFDTVDPSEIENLGVQPLNSLQVLGIEAQLVCEILQGQELAEDVDLDGVMENEKQAIYRSAREDAINAFKLMREIVG